MIDFPNDYLFVCSANWLRSPTAEHLARLRGWAADSAGTYPEAVRRLTAEAIQRARRIVCMEPKHADAVRQLHWSADERIEVWNIPDRFDYCDPELVRLLRIRIPKRVDRPGVYGGGSAEDLLTLPSILRRQAD